jgi:uncharacterized caspase-like protein
MKKALVVGLNTYQTQKSLRGCVNDAADVARLLRDTFQFDDVVVLPESAVTKATLLAALQALFVAAPGEGDGERVFFFAGHGGRVFDLNGDEVDHIDENLCLPDYDSSNPATYLLDDEFANILRDAQGAAPQLRRIILLDSCHSGTATRDVDASLDWETVTQRLQASFRTNSPTALGWASDDPRLALVCVPRMAEDPPELAAALERTDSAGITASTFGLGENGEPVSHQLLSGCNASQTCKDVPLDGVYRGIFTYTLCEIARANPAISWQALRDQVLQVIEATFGQSPQLEGPAAMKLLSIFR